MMADALCFRSLIFCIFTVMVYVAVVGSMLICVAVITNIKLLIKTEKLTSGLPGNGLWPQPGLVGPGFTHVDGTNRSHGFDSKWFAARRHWTMSSTSQFKLSLAVAWLLLVGIERNPGPTSATFNHLNVGPLNARSATLHVADLHALIQCESLDVLAVTETRVGISDPDAINKDLAPSGYNIINVPRADDRPYGGLAIIYRGQFNFSPMKLGVSPKSFDVMAARLLTGAMSFVFVNVYRLHSFSIAAFTDEFCDLLDELRDAKSHVVIAGDFNCPGDDQNAIDSRLSALLSCYNLVVVNDGPTRLNYDGGTSKLDLLAEFDETRRLAVVPPLYQSASAIIARSTATVSSAANR